MKYFLAAVAITVNHEPVSIFRDTFIGGDLLRCQNEFAN